MRAGSDVNSRFGGRSPSGALCGPRTSTVEGFEPPRRFLDVSGIWYLVYCTSPIAYPIVNGYSPSGTWGPRTSTGGFGYSPSGARAPVPLR